MLTKRIAISRAKKFVNECAALPLKIDRAILFGSSANGMAGKNSDIDIALFSDNFSDNILSNLDIIGSVNIRYPEIDVHTYPSKYLKGNKSYLLNIQFSGIEITT